MTNAEVRTAEGNYKLAEIGALRAEHEAQNIRALSQHHEQYGSMAWALELRVKADELDKVARVAEDKATTLYSYWALLADA